MPWLCLHCRELVWVSHMTGVAIIMPGKKIKKKIINTDDGDRNLKRCDYTCDFEEIKDVRKSMGVKKHKRLLSKWQEYSELSCMIFSILYT